MVIQRGRLPLALILLSALACEGYTEKLQDLWIHRDEIEYTYKGHVKAYAYATCKIVVNAVLAVIIPKPIRAAFASIVGLIGRTSSIVVRTGTYIAKLALTWGALNVTFLASAVALDTFGLWAFAAFVAWRTPEYIRRKFRAKVLHYIHLLLLPLLVSTLLVKSLICSNDHSPREATENPRGVDMTASSEISDGDAFVECDPKAPLAPGYVRISFGATIDGKRGCTVHGAVPKAARVSAVLARVGEITGFPPSMLRLSNAKSRAYLDPNGDLRDAKGPLKVQHVYLLKSELYVRGFGRTIVVEVAAREGVKYVKQRIA